MRDRSFIHRTRQSREAKADNLRRFGPAPVRDPFPVPAVSFWARLMVALRAFLKWVKA